MPATCWCRPSGSGTAAAPLTRSTRLIGGPCRTGCRRTNPLAAPRRARAAGPMAAERRSRLLGAASGPARLGERLRRRVEAGRSGRAGAAERLRRPGRSIMPSSATGPGSEGTSRFSPHLHFGELSPRLVWHSLPEEAGEKFRKELAWRDFSHNVMLTQPEVGETAGRAAFADFPWRRGLGGGLGLRGLEPGADRLSDRRRRNAPIVGDGLDAQPGPDDRRLLPGEASADRLAARGGVVLGHSGRRRLRQQQPELAVDRRHRGRQPAVRRIMAPIVQSEKFGAGDYIREWVPELRGLSDEQVHDPGDSRGRPAIPKPSSATAPPASARSRRWARSRRRGRSRVTAPVTPDGRYIVVDGRLWRASDPALPARPGKARRCADGGAGGP